MGMEQALLTGSVKHGVLGVLLCLLSSVPLANLSKKTASLLAVLLTAVVALLQKVRDRRSLPSDDGGNELLVCEDANGQRHEVLFLGDSGVGKSSLISALREHVPPYLRERSRRLSRSNSSSSSLPAAPDGCARAPSSARQHVVIVWTANLPESMRAYATRWRSAAVATGGRHVPTLIVCNMTDVAPCPLPEMNAMRGTKIPALAVSAARGTNIGALWVLIERSIAASLLPSPSPALSPSIPRRVEHSEPTAATVSTSAAATAATAVQSTTAQNAPTVRPEALAAARETTSRLPSTPSPASVIPFGENDALESFAHVLSSASSHDGVSDFIGADEPRKDGFEHSYDVYVPRSAEVSAAAVATAA